MAHTRGRHRAPAKHRRPKKSWIAAPVVAVAALGVVLSGSAAAPAASAAVVVNPVALSSDLPIDGSKIDSQVVTDIVTEKVPFATKVTDDPSLAAGTQFVAQPGEHGKAKVTYIVTLVDGVEVNRTEVSRSLIRSPQPQVEVHGTGNPADMAIALKSAAAKTGDAEGNQAYAKLYIADTYGWGEAEFGCLVELWNRESHWRQAAHNRSSGAHGIPQALPGRKMAEFGSDWKTNPVTQIKWGAAYIERRFDTPCGALAWHDQHNWY